MITYPRFSVRLIFLTQFLHTEYNWLTKNRIVFLRKIRIQRPKPKFRLFLLLWDTVILCFHLHIKPCYYHNTDFRQYIYIYRKYFFPISVIFHIPVTLTFFFGLDLNLFRFRLSSGTTLRLLL